MLAVGDHTMNVHHFSDNRGRTSGQVNKVCIALAPMSLPDIFGQGVKRTPDGAVPMIRSG